MKDRAVLTLEQVNRTIDLFTLLYKLDISAVLRTYWFEIYQDHFILKEDEDI